ncbi:hypothetical protein [Oleiharenicola sp. Vm1]|uniref:hypothetical protein n=1 Tax=Oleiharenicola sp. Vm1 TaxID=3398393 RepID=UPI0039F55BD7
MNTIAPTLVLLTFLLPIACFSIYGFWRSTDESEGNSLDDRFLHASQKTKKGDISASTVSYMLQISTTFYFIYWGYNYGASNILYLISWGIGMWLFSLYAPRLLAVRSSYVTLAGFLSSPFAAPCRRIVGGLIAFFFLGLFYVETSFASDFLSKLFAQSKTYPETAVWWVFFFALGISVFCYSILGGMRKVVATDKVQLSMAYVGFAIVFCLLLPNVVARSGLTGILLWIISTALYAVLFFYSRGDRSTPLVRLSLVISLFIIVTAGLFYKPWQGNMSAGVDIEGLFKQLLEPYGWVTLLGFTLANILWQFADGSNYQRIASLELDDLKTEEEKHARIRDLFLGLVVVSPLTWGFGIILGIFLRASGTVTAASGEEYVSFLNSLSAGVVAGNSVSLVIAIALGTAMSGVMLSTADSAVLAFFDTTIRDILRTPTLTARRYLWLGLLGFSIVVGCAMAHRLGGVSSILVVASAVNALILILALPAIAYLHGVRFSALALLLTTSVGFVATGYVTLWPPTSIPFNIQMVLPILVAVIASVPGVIVAILQGKRQQSPDTDVTAAKT